jgi:PPOX class probable F420-dependent enzyme
VGVTHGTSSSGDDGPVESWTTAAISAARVARLGTTGGDGAVRVVPICFAVVDGWLVSAVDHKPKRSDRLRRLDDISLTGVATVLIDQYDEDWTRLWWVRVRGRAQVLAADDPHAATARHALTVKYHQYRDQAPSGAVYRIALDEITSWRWTPVD